MEYVLVNLFKYRIFIRGDNPYRNSISSCPLFSSSFLFSLNSYFLLLFPDLLLQGLLFPSSQLNLTFCTDLLLVLALLLFLFLLLGHSFCLLFPFTPFLGLHFSFFHQIPSFLFPLNSSLSSLSLSSFFPLFYFFRLILLSSISYC